jgi:ATP-binding cassette subfamily C protein LapB
MKATSTIEPVDVPYRVCSSLEHLPILLSRIASHYGHALPAHRFSLAALEAMGIDTATDTVATVIELWKSALPLGDVDALEHEPDREQLPLLWIPESMGQPLIVRGKGADGSFHCERADGSSVRMASSELHEGDFLLLSTVTTQAEPSAPRNARQWFLHAIAKRRQVFIEATVATFVVSMLGLGASFYSLQVYDRVIPTQAHSTLLALTFGVAIAVVFEFVLKQVRSLMVDRGCKAIEEELSDVFFGRMLDIRMEVRPRAVGTFAAQVRQFELVRNFMTSSTVFLIADLPFCFLFVAVIGMIGGMLATIPLLLLPLVLASSAWLNWRVRRLTQNQLRDTRNKNGLLVDVIDGIESIKAAGAEWKMMERWRQLTASASALELDTRHLSSTSAHLAQFLQQLSYVAIIGLGAWMVGVGQITMGALIACSILSNRALSPITQIATLVTQWQHAREALRGLDEMMALAVEHPEGSKAIIPSSCSGAIRLDGAGFSFNGKLPALQPLTLSFCPGERAAIVGPVGSGKSTLIRLLSGLYRPSEGKAFLDGVDMALLAPEFLHEQIGYLPQDVRLLRGTLRENLALGLAPPADGELLRVAELTGLHRVISAHPLGLDLPIFEGGRGLSGGQRQLVGLTRLLIAKPKVLLLDEPTAAMDGELEASVMQHVFSALPDQTTMIIVTHKTSLLRLLDRIIVMDQGRVALDGPRTEVLARLTAPVPQTNPAPTASMAQESR